MEVKIRNEINHRYLAAIRLVDTATGSIIKRSLSVSAEGLTFFQNLSRLYVIKRATGLEAHIDQFTSVPESPAIGSLPFEISITDPLGKYLPRQLATNLPRNSDNEEDNNVMTPIEVSMFNAATASLNPNWSIIRASILQSTEDDAQPLQGALLRVVRTDDDELLSTGLSDQRGEALIIIPGIPVTNFSTEEIVDDDDDDENDSEFAASGSVVSVTTSVRIEVIVNPEIPWPVDTDELESEAASWIRNADDPILIQLRTGRTETVAIEVAVSDPL